MDIVYLFKESSNNDSSELRYSLRSLQNINHDNVFIVGEKPAWVTNVHFIPVPQNSTKKDNVTHNLSVAAETDAISDDFILMNDDFFFMKKMDHMPTLHWGSLPETIARYNSRYEEETDYIQTMKHTLELLIGLGYTDTLSYELHIPMVFNKAKVREMFDKAPEPIYQFRTYYGNCFQMGGERKEDVKVFIEPRHNDPAYNQNPQAYLDAQSFLSATGGAFRGELVGEYVRERFLNKSPYEI